MPTLTTTQVAAFTTQQLGNLATDDLSAMTTAQFAAISFNQAPSLTTLQISNLESQDLAALRVATVRSLTTDQLMAITTADFQALTTAQIATLTTQQTYALTTDQIVAFTTAQIPGLGAANIAAMNTAQIAAFETADIAVMSSAQLDAHFLATPIVLDLNGDGIQTRAAADGVQFDLLGTGTTAKWGWATGGDGLLVRDRNHDGVINNGTELYGAATQRADGTRAGNGYAAMALEDSNHDGKLNARDAHWKELQLWVDANHDGKTDAGELHGLAEFGIVELDITAKVGTDIQNGNLIGLVSSYTKDDGSQHAVADVWFAKDVAPEQADKSAPATLGDLLAAPATELLPAGSGMAAGGAAATQAGLTLAQRQMMDDELKAPNLML
jgi:hypothetical protein